jgi:hypothetical protein
MAASKKATQAKDDTDKNHEATPADASAFLKEQHAQIRAVLANSGEDASERREVIREIAAAWVPHVQLEEEILYPAARESVEAKTLDQAQVQRDLAGILLGDLLRGSEDDPFLDAKFAVLTQQISQIMEFEEKPKDGLLALVAASGVDMKSLLPRLQEQSEENKRNAEADISEPPEPRSLRTRVSGRGRRPEESEDMARQSSNMRERDEHGRFMSDDDDRDMGRGGSRNGNRDRDENGRFMSEDDRGYSSRSGRGWDDDDRGGYRSSGRDRDENGRFMSEDERGYSSRSSRGRDYDDDRRDSRFGGRERDEYGRFASEDERYSSRSGRGRDYDDEDDRRGSRSGWYGDSEGHSEASRRGWDERQGGSRSRSRDDDYRSGSRGEGHGWDERQGGMRSRSSREEDDDDRRGSRGGHGGWSGDPEGHAEAARRGWQHRR